MPFKIPSLIDREIFRTNDIRGTLGVTLSADVVYALGLALGSLIKESGQRQFVVARDSRASSPQLGHALAQGLIETGCEVIDIGAVPAPVLYFATRVLNASSGAVITGSHNPAGDNGLKIVLRGKIASYEELISLLDRIVEKNFSSGLGTVKPLDMLEAYYTHITQHVSFARPLRVVVDCGNAIPGKVAPLLLRRMGCEVIELFCDVLEDFPHHFPDPSEPKNLSYLIESVKANQADVGIAFDGDGDRLGVVTNKGRIIWPDRQLLLFAKEVLAHHPGAKIIYDVKCTMHLDPWILEHGGEPIMWKTGHSLIEAKLEETKAMLAGEMSGHFFFCDRWFGFDDGIYSAVRLIEILANDSRSCDAVFASLPDSVNTPEIRIAMIEERKQSFMQAFQDTAIFEQGKVITLDGVRVNFDFGFGLVRASNTTAYLILRFEADNEVHLRGIQQLFKQKMLNVDSTLVFPF